MTAPIIIGFDTEYVQEGAGSKKNQPLSYQTYGIASGGEWPWIDMRETFDKRPTLSQVLSATILEGLDKGVLDEWPSELILAAHFTPADLPMLRDFWKRQLFLKGVRKCLITFKPL